MEMLEVMQCEIIYYKLWRLVGSEALCGEFGFRFR